MATSSGKKRSASTQKSRGTTGSKNTQKTKSKSIDYRKESELFHEIGLIIFFIVMVLLFLCNFGIVGVFGNAIRNIMFGIFGFVAYVIPVVLFIGVCFWYANAGNPHAIRKILSAVFLLLMIGVLFDMLAKNASNLTEYNIKTIYENCKIHRNGGGVFAGSIHYILNKYLGFVGTVLVVVLCIAVSFILLTEKSFPQAREQASPNVRRHLKQKPAPSPVWQS